MLPGFSPQQIELVGNSSLAGAFLALMDSGVLAEMKHIAEHLETVELNLEPDFESVYIDQGCEEIRNRTIVSHAHPRCPPL
jgi:uncharacterized 2Fe-2S/4Fe-4S cluster protein (DUF4445 family)